ncbi:hypothetical protein HDV05_004663 [Chytridiales sp. JEL 0842]|nr:hypothetical protein HDV05_004663 [Chytridiales sp. JEL 0842]
MSHIHPTTSPDTHSVEFNAQDATCFICANICCYTVWSGVGIVCCPCIYFYSYKAARNQKCTINDKQIEYFSGWLSTSDQWIALDRIQNVAIEKPFMCGLANVTNLSIQTAGATGAGESGSDGTARLMGCKDAAKVRDIIIAKRDALAQKARAPPGGGSGGDGIFITKQPGAGPSMYDAIVSLTNSINQLESKMAKSSS